MSIKNALCTVDTAVSSLTDSISELTLSSSNIPSFVSDSLVGVKKRMKELMDELDSKVRQTNQSLDSAHIKLNSLDTQMKKCMTKQDTMSESINKILDMVGRLYEKVEDMENQSEETNTGFNTNDMGVVLDHLNQFQSPQVVSRIPDDNISITSEKSGETVVQDKSITDSASKSTNNTISDSTEMIGQNSRPENRKISATNNPISNMNNEGYVTATCDNLIISDSMLKRINPRKFSPKQTTIKKFVSGGIIACTNFINQQGGQYKPKKVLIHIGTRDLPHKTITEVLFNKMLDIAVRTWDTAEIYLLPLIERKDQSQVITDEANQMINSVCERHKVTLLQPFKPDSNMYYDQVHLNDKIGLPRLIQHIKSGMNLVNYMYRTKVHAPKSAEHNRQYQGQYPRSENTQIPHERGQPPTHTSATYESALLPNVYNTVRPTGEPTRDLPNYSASNIQNSQMTPWAYGMPNIPVVPPFQSQNFPWIHHWPVSNVHFQNQLHVPPPMGV